MRHIIGECQQTNDLHTYVPLDSDFDVHASVGDIYKYIQICVNASHM